MEAVDLELAPLSSVNLKTAGDNMNGVAALATPASAVSKSSSTEETANDGSKVDNIGRRKHRRKKNKANKETPEEERLRLAANDAAVIALREAKARQHALDALLPELSPPSVVYVNTAIGISQAFDVLAKCNLFGFDTESGKIFDSGSSTRQPTLLQISGVLVPGGAAAYTPHSNATAAFTTATVFLFDLMVLLPVHGNIFSDMFQGIVRAKDALFLGVGLHQDFMDLAKFYGGCVPCFTGVVRGALDVGNVKGEEEQCGLSRGAARFAGIKITKGRIQRSNWAVRPLSRQQIVYAANDARAALAIFSGAGIKAFNEAESFCAGKVVVWMCVNCQMLSLKEGFNNCIDGCQGHSDEEKRKNRERVAMEKMKCILSIPQAESSGIVERNVPPPKIAEHRENENCILADHEILEKALAEKAMKQNTQDRESIPEMYLLPFTLPIYGDVVRGLETAARTKRFEKRRASKKRKIEAEAKMAGRLEDPRAGREQNCFAYCLDI